MLNESTYRIAVYPVLSALGMAAAALCAAVLVFIEWKKRRRTQASPPDARRSLLHPFTPDMRKRCNPVAFLLCFALSYALLLPGIHVTGLLLNFTIIDGKLQFFNSGAAFASGILLVIPAFLLLARLFPGNGNPAQQLELVMPAMALHHVFNRLACFFSGCCFGIPCGFGVVYPDTAPASVLYGAGTRVFPNQLLESMLMLLCFALMVILRARGKRTLPVFPLVFGAAGFLLGFAMNHSHEPLRPLFGFTYPAPFTHLLVFFAGVVFLLLSARKTKENRGTGG